MFQPLDPGLLALITSGKLSDALANKAIIGTRMFCGPAKIARLTGILYRCRNSCGSLGYQSARGTETPATACLSIFPTRMNTADGLTNEQVINNIANTQKDPFPNQLKIGVRFFDFRPGYWYVSVSLVWAFDLIFPNSFHDVINMQKGVRSILLI
jgi:hypothetical protein